MAHYIDAFVLPVPKVNMARYKRMATAAGKIWMEYGALQYWECMGDDLENTGPMLPFPKMTKSKPGETVMFSWIVFKDRRHRDQVNKKVLADPRMDEMYRQMMSPKIFDDKRMAYGGFKAIVECG
ncbi:MAG: DUF1428 domain-containing protein [Flavobacteriales bacterium]|nr:DUF1428 domain-containing protein [Flavobacteriales bacterium]